MPNSLSFLLSPSFSVRQDVFAIYLVCVRRLSFSYIHRRRQENERKKRQHRKKKKNRNPFDCRKEMPKCNKKSPVYLRFECFRSFLGENECTRLPCRYEHLCAMMRCNALFASHTTKTKSTSGMWPNAEWQIHTSAKHC